MCVWRAEKALIWKFKQILVIISACSIWISANVTKFPEMKNKQQNEGFIVARAHFHHAFLLIRRGWIIVHLHHRLPRKKEMSRDKRSFHDFKKQKSKKIVADITNRQDDVNYIFTHDGTLSIQIVCSFFWVWVGKLRVARDTKLLKLFNKNLPEGFIPWFMKVISRNLNGMKEVSQWTSLCSFNLIWALNNSLQSSKNLCKTETNREFYESKRFCSLDVTCTL